MLEDPGQISSRNSYLQNLQIRGQDLVKLSLMRWDHCDFLEITVSFTNFVTIFSKVMGPGPSVDIDCFH